ncbi:MAG TPA: hypothetical protein VFJ60_11075 [Gaiella sp.]|nr:hypothetical protein [Gaiella sp.]
MASAEATRAIDRDKRRQPQLVPERGVVAGRFQLLDDLWTLEFATASICSRWSWDEMTLSPSLPPTFETRMYPTAWAARL